MCGIVAVVARRSGRTALAPAWPRPGWRPPAGTSSRSRCHRSLRAGEKADILSDWSTPGEPVDPRVAAVGQVVAIIADLVAPPVIDACNRDLEMP